MFFPKNIFEKKRLLILGGGFAAVSLLRKISLDAYDVTVVSKRNHFLFTPLLPSTTVGTIEFRSIIEPIRRVRQGVKFFQASASSLDPVRKIVKCKSDELQSEFDLEYDLLVIAVGAFNNTFNVPGVKEHALFLKELTDARAIREKIIANLERASVPGVSREEKQRLLHFVVVGGGPTGVEFAAELHDLLRENVTKSYPDLALDVQVSLYEAGASILTSFDEGLRDFAMRTFKRGNIDLHLSTRVAEIGDGFVRLTDDTRIPAGLVVWSSGIAATPFVSRLDFAKDRVGRLLTDEYLRLRDHPEIYVPGDCGATADVNLPQTAQVAMQQGKYLAKTLNQLSRQKPTKPFKFNNLGMLAYVGDNRALADIPKAKLRWRGVLTYLFWRSAYLTKLVSFKNKALVLFDWIKTSIFGRDLSRF